MSQADFAHRQLYGAPFTTPVRRSPEVLAMYRAQIVAMANAYKDARRDMRKVGLL